MNQLQTNLIAAAVGATIGVLSVASIYIYQKILENKQRPMNVNVNIEVLNRRLNNLEEELEALRRQQNQQRKKKINRRHASNDNTCTVTDETDAFSTAGTDVGNDEFFDCSDSENGISDIENWSTEITTPGLDYCIFDERIELEISQKDIYLDLQKLIHDYPNDVNLVWRFAKSSVSYIHELTNPSEKENVLLKAINICDKFLTLSNVDLHKWYAILLGLHSEFLPTIKDKLDNGFRYKNHIQEALNLCPNDATLHHLYGRYLFEFAKLSWVEKKVVTTLYADAPNVSYADALEKFELSEKFADIPNPENQLYISKCYIAQKNYEQAVQWLEKICNSTQMNEFNKHDQSIFDDAQEFLNKYSVYKKNS